MRQTAMSASVKLEMTASRSPAARSAPSTSCTSGKTRHDGGDQKRSARVRAIVAVSPPTPSSARMSWLYSCQKARASGSEDSKVRPARSAAR